MRHLEGRILSVRADSGVFVGSYEGRECVVKTYSPESFPHLAEHHSEAYPTKTIFANSYRYDHRKSLFNRESGILRGLNLLDGLVTPELFHIDKKSLAIYMELLRGKTYQTKMLMDPSRANVDTLTGELVDHLSDLHLACDAQLEGIAKASGQIRRGGANYLRRRGVEEEVYRWDNYFKRIVYNLSPDFQDYCDQHNIELGAVGSKQVNRALRSFLESKEISLRDEVMELVSLNTSMVGTDVGFVSGDFGPHNVFSATEGRPYRIIDLDKSRIASPHIDLVTAVYHIGRYPFKAASEPNSLGLAARYFGNIGKTDNLQHRLGAFVSSRLKENVRLFSVYCNMDKKEMRKFLGGSRLSGEYSSLSNGELRAKLLDDLFGEHFAEFFDYYRPGRGEGWALVFQGLDNDDKNSMARQLSIVENIFTKSGILQGKVKNQARAISIRNLMRKGGDLESQV